ncbi:hypothetical protein WDZ16_03815 [Pseudokineococcus marinus]|uniref:Serine O-acetyltransferase n=1 Tax=Pseudokineococcus marinus TaxID=351215 RepID=A0A849BFQ3_9ACTN|nr:hypothetical protein [Pseudokineococcus marinus]
MVHPSVRIGAGVTLYHRVTLGVRGGHQGPTLEDDVYVGTGAAVLGPVQLGAGCSVGANAVVVRDVEPGATAVGVPSHGRDRG